MKPANVPLQAYKLLFYVRFVAKMIVEGNLVGSGSKIPAKMVKALTHSSFAVTRTVSIR
jgi:hypothetical protein